MKVYLAFTKKEFMESIRNYKLFVLIIIFLLLGMMNPITAKFTPQLLASFLPPGMSITLPDPSAIDSWAQFYKNVPQLGLIVLVIVFSGLMSNEFSRGTLINILTKGLSRSTVIFAKLTSALSIWTVVYFLCFGISYAYTLYFWPDDPVSHLLFSVFCLWLFGVLLISLLILGGIIFKNTSGSLLFTGGLVVLLFILNIFPALQDYNPIALASGNLALVKGEAALSDFTWPLIISSIAAIGCIFSSILLFNKKEL